MKNSKNKLSSEQEMNELDALNSLSEELSLKNTSKFRKITRKILGKLKFLSKKKFWIPLLVFHILMFAGMGYFAYYQATKAHDPAYFLKTFKQSLQVQDTALFNDLIDINTVSDNFLNDLIKNIQNYKQLYFYMEGIPNTEFMADTISMFVLDILKDKEYSNEYNDKKHFIPTNISQLLKEAEFKLYKNENEATFLLSTTIFDPTWERIPLQFEITQTDKGLKITKLANLKQIFQVYNKKLTAHYQQEQNYKNIKQSKELNQIKSYFPEARCNAQVMTLHNKPILYLNFKSSPNHQGKNVVSLAMQITLLDDKRIQLYENTFSNNLLFSPNNEIQTSWNVSLDDNLAQLLENAQTIICEVVPVMVNTDDGLYIDIRKK